MAEAFSFTPWMGMVFFKYCLRYNITDEKDKVMILRRLVAKKKAKYLPRIGASLQGKKIIIIRNNKPEN